jgi:hypothetical protein
VFARVAKLGTYWLGAVAANGMERTRIGMVGTASKKDNGGIFEETASIKRV